MALALSEDAEHDLLADWLDRRGLFWHHSPMGGSRTARSGQRIRRMGARKGAPDFLVFDPPPGGRHVGAAVEMKRSKRGRTSVEQRAFLERLAALGWATRVSPGAADAVAFLEGLGY